MALELKWHGEQFKKHIRNATAQGLQRATVFLHAECRREVSKPNSGVRMQRRTRQELVSVKSQLKEIETKTSYFDEKTATIKQRKQLRIINKKKFKTVRRGSYTIYPDPSKPGDPPKLRTGFGQRNIVQEFDASIPAGRVGVTKNALYMFYLELGTRRVKRRPWLMATLLKQMGVIGKLAATGGDGK